MTPEKEPPNSNGECPFCKAGVPLSAKKYGYIRLIEPAGCYLRAPIETIKKILAIANHAMKTYEVTRTTTETIMVQAENEREAISLAENSAHWQSFEPEYLADGQTRNYCEHGTPTSAPCSRCNQ